MIEIKKWKSWVGGVVGAVLVGGAIMLGGVVVGNTAISQLVGLAVAQSSTLWNNVIDAAKGDGQATGILAQAPYLYNGVTFDRARGDIANGMDVDVTRMSGSITPADAYVNPTTANQVWSLSGLFNGTTWDRQDGVSATNNTATTSIGVAYTTPLSIEINTRYPAKCLKKLLREVQHSLTCFRHTIFIVTFLAAKPLTWVISRKP